MTKRILYTIISYAALIFYFGMIIILIAAYFEGKYDDASHHNTIKIESREHNGKIDEKSERIIPDAGIYAGKGSAQRTKEMGSRGALFDGFEKMETDLCGNLELSLPALIIKSLPIT